MENGVVNTRREEGDGQTPIAQIADELNVETIMEGTVQYAGDQVRITAQLIDPGTGSHLWSGNYDRPFADLFAIQSEIARAMVDAADLRLTAEASRRPTGSFLAYEQYLEGRYFLNQGWAPGRGLKEAIDSGAWLVGPADQVTEKLKDIEARYPGLESVNVGQVIGTPESVILEQLERFSEEVMPAFTN